MGKTEYPNLYVLMDDADYYGPYFCTVSHQWLMVQRHIELDKYRETHRCFVYEYEYDTVIRDYLLKGTWNWKQGEWEFKDVTEGGGLI